MVNPHWDETINEDEDIGFRGPHFNELKNYPDPTPYPGHETWSPRGEYGQHGEFSGWRSQEDPTSYTSDWQDYPGDEFTGIETIRPNKLGAPRRKAGQAFPWWVLGGKLKWVVKHMDHSINLVQYMTLLRITQD